MPIDASFSTPSSGKASSTPFIKPPAPIPDDNTVGCAHDYTEDALHHDLCLKPRPTKQEDASPARPMQAHAHLALERLRRQHSQHQQRTCALAPWALISPCHYGLRASPCVIHFSFLFLVSWCAARPATNAPFDCCRLETPDWCTLVHTLLLQKRSGFRLHAPPTDRSRLPMPRPAARCCRDSAVTIFRRRRPR